jgi:hypothetical protein
MYSKVPSWKIGDRTPSLDLSIPTRSNMAFIIFTPFYQPPAVDFCDLIFYYVGILPITLAYFDS